MSDVVIEGNGRPESHRCHAQAGQGANAVACFACYLTTHQRDARLDGLDASTASSPQPLEPRRMLTAREVQHRGRMLRWLLRA